MKTLRKTLALCLSAAIAAMLLAGCGAPAQSGTPNTATSGAGTSGEKTTVIFWDENAGPNRTPYYEELIARFEQENPDIDIEYVGLPSSDAKSKIDVAISAGQTPDVSGMPVQWAASYILNDVLEPLDGYFDSWSEKDNLNVSILDSVRTVDVNNGLYVLPTTSNFNPMFWGRADWFKEKGVEAPQTWDEFFTLCETFTDSTNGTYGYSIRGGAGSPMQLQEYLHAYSGIEAPFDENGKSTIDDPKNIEALERLAAIYNKFTPESDISNGYKEMVAAFDTGSVAMISHNLGSYGEHAEALEKDSFFAFAPPAAENGTRIVSGVYPLMGYAIYKNSKVKDAAWKFVSFLGSEESQSYWNQKIGQAPTNTTLETADWVKESQHISAAMNALSDPNTVAFPYPLYLPDYQSIQDSIALPGFQAVLSGQQSAQAMLTEWADAMTTAQAEYAEYILK